MYLPGRKIQVFTGAAIKEKKKEKIKKIKIKLESWQEKQGIRQKLFKGK